MEATDEAARPRGPVGARSTIILVDVERQLALMGGSLDRATSWCRRSAETYQPVASFSAPSRMSVSASRRSAAPRFVSDDSTSAPAG